MMRAKTDEKIDARLAEYFFERLWFFKGRITQAMLEENFGEAWHENIFRKVKLPAGGAFEFKMVPRRAALDFLADLESQPWRENADCEIDDGFELIDILPERGLVKPRQGRGAA